MRVRERADMQGFTGSCSVPRRYSSDALRPCIQVAGRNAGCTTSAGGQNIALGLQVATSLAHWVTPQILSHAGHHGHRRSYTVLWLQTEKERSLSRV